MKIGKIVLIAALALTPYLPLAAAERPTEVSRVGILAFTTVASNDVFIQVFRQQLHDLGHVEGTNMEVELRYAEGRPERVPDIAGELARLPLHVIFAFGTDLAVAAKKATGVTPIVFMASGDPVRLGLVQNLARPGGNITGITLIASELAVERLEMLKEVSSSMSRVGVLWNPDHKDYNFREIEAAARKLRIEVQSLDVRQSDDFEKAFQTAIKGKVDALLVLPTRLTFLARQQIADFGLRNGLPMASGWSEFAEAGGLFTYGPNLKERVRRAASYVDKILKGATPGDLPVEQPTNLELVVNLKTAKMLHLTIPDSILVRADRVIE